MPIVSKAKKNGTLKPPPKRLRPIAWSYPFPELEVDGHFDVRVAADEDQALIYGRVHSSAQGFRRRNGKQYKFRITVYRPGMIRCWRLS